MKYKVFEIIEEEEQGTDELGNPITKQSVTGTFTGRVTPWTTEDIALLGRDVTSTSGKVLTFTAPNIVNLVQRVRIEGNTYSVERIPDLGRWRVLCMKGWKL